MKNIGNTNEGNVLVEMSRKEYAEFSKLHEAVTGNTLADYQMREPERAFEFDFQNVFHVIRVFYAAHFKVNDFQYLLDEIKAKLNSQ